MICELPPDASFLRLSGPSGPLRVVERHSGGVPAVVFVHGLAGRLEHWSAQLAALPPTRRGVAFDLPGHGGSEAGGQCSLRAFAAAIAAVTEALDLQRQVLVAHSLGATAAIVHAGEHRERVAGLFLVDPSGDQSRIPRAAFLDRVRRDPGAEMAANFRYYLTGAPSEVRRKVLADLAATPAAVILEALESASVLSPLPALERYGGPVRCVVSEPNDHPTSLHRLVPSLPLDRICGASHWLMLDRPQEISALLGDFLARVAP